ncbi:hypothetical protein AOLI_G00186320 [Acnodon oligacanthus]
MLGFPIQARMQQSLGKNPKATFTYRCKLFWIGGSNKYFKSQHNIYPARLKPPSKMPPVFLPLPPHGVIDKFTIPASSPQSERKLLHRKFLWNAIKEIRPENEDTARAAGRMLLYGA